MAYSVKQNPNSYVVRSYISAIRLTEGSNLPNKHTSPKFSSEYVYRPRNIFESYLCCGPFEMLMRTCDTICMLTAIHPIERNIQLIASAVINKFIKRLAPFKERSINTIKPDLLKTRDQFNKFLVETRKEAAIRLFSDLVASPEELETLIAEELNK